MAASADASDKLKEISRAELKETTAAAANKAKAPSFPTSKAELQPMLESLRQKSLELGLTEGFTKATAFMRDQVASAGLRLQRDMVFSTLEDFERVDPDAKRIVVIGVTGAGKSTVLNCMGGWGFVQKPPDYAFEWQEKDGVKALFEARADTDSCTKKTSFANLAWLGDAERSIVAVDTPGHDDPAGAEIESKEARDKLGEMAADLHNKMKALGHIHAILVLHNDVHSNRLNPATYTVLKMIGEKFAKSEVSCWKHVVVGYSKCNAHETSWRSGLAKKKKDLQAEIRKKIEMCDEDVPVIALGGGTIEPAPPVASELDGSDGFEALWRFIAAAEPLDTSVLQPFEGADVKWQKIIDAKDEAELRAKAAMIWVAVMFKLTLLLVAMFWRSFMLPSFLGYLMLNLPGVYDEAVILILFAKWLGPKEVMYSAQHFFYQYVDPYTKPYTDEMMKRLGKAKAD